MLPRRRLAGTSNSTQDGVDSDSDGLAEALTATQTCVTLPLEGRRGGGRGDTGAPSYAGRRPDNLATEARLNAARWRQRLSDGLPDGEDFDSDSDGIPDAFESDGDWD